MYYLLDSKEIEALKYKRSRQFYAESAFVAAFKSMQESLQRYANKPGADRAQVEDRNEIMQALADFANTTDELLQSVNDYLDGKILAFGANEHQHTENIVFSAADYANEQFIEATTSGNAERRKVALHTFLAISEAINGIIYLSHVHPDATCPALDPFTQTTTAK